MQCRPPLSRPSSSRSGREPECAAVTNSLNSWRPVRRRRRLPLHSRKRKKTFQLLSRSLQRNNAAHLNTFFFLPTKTKKDILFTSREKVPWNHSKPQWRAASNSTCYAPPAAHDTRGSISILSMPNTTTTERTREWYGKRKNPKDSLWIVEYNSSPVISQSRNLNKESTTATCTTEEVNRSQRHFVA